MNIYEKLNIVQAQLRVPKNQHNHYGGFQYRSLEDIVEVAKPLLINQNLSLTLSDSIKLIGDRFYIEATAILVNVEKPDEKIITTAIAREAVSKKGMDESQITGATSTYARKYCLGGLFNIDDTKDADFPIQHQYNNNGKTQRQSQMQYTGNTSSSAAVNNFQPPPPPIIPPINNYPPANTVQPQTNWNFNQQQSQQQPNNDDGRLSGKQYKFILSLMGNANKSKDEMDQVCITNYGRTLQHLSKKDASQLIESLTAK